MFPAGQGGVSIYCILRAYTEGGTPWRRPTASRSFLNRRKVAASPCLCLLFLKSSRKATQRAKHSPMRRRRSAPSSPIDAIMELRSPPMLIPKFAASRWPHSMSAARLPAVDGRRVVRALTRAEFVVDRIVGSHHVLKYSGEPTRAVVVPVTPGES